MKATEKVALILVLWIGLLATWLAGAAWAQSPELEDAKRLNEHAQQLLHQGKYADALLFAQKSLKIREKLLISNHPDIAISLNNIAAAYASMGKYAEAEAAYRRSLSILENSPAKSFGFKEDSPALAVTLNNLAQMYVEMRNYTAAEPMYKRSLAMMEKTLGPKHPKMVTILENMAELYDSMFNYAEAVQLLKRSLAIKEEEFGPYHPDVAIRLNIIAKLFAKMGNYGEAEPTYKRSLNMLEKIMGPDHPDVAESLNNLAAFYASIDNNAAAEPLYKRSLAIREKKLGPNHLNVATSLNNLAALYAARGNYAEAESLCKRSLAIKEEKLGPDHPDVATSLNNIAALYAARGNYVEAEPLCKRSLAIREKKLGSDHTDVATSLNNLAELYRAVGNYAAAEPLYKRSLAIHEKVLGPDNLLLAKSLVNLSLLYVLQDKPLEGFLMKVRALAIEETLMDQLAGLGSGENALEYITKAGGSLHSLMTLTTTHLKKDGAARKETFNIWLRRKGVVLEAQRRMQQALLDAGDRDAAKVFEGLSQARTRLAELSFAGPGKEGSEGYKKKLRELNEQKEELEAKLSRLSQTYAKARTVRKVTIEEVAKVLPQGSVLVDFARIDVFNFDSKGKDKKWLPAHYLAFVLRPGQGQDVALIDLGAAEEIDTAVNQFKNAVTQKQDAKTRDLVCKLHDMVFTPVQKEIGGAQRVFLSPDGALNLLPFEILRDPEGRYLIEKYTFNYLAAGRDLVGFSEKKASAEKPLLLGDPDFDLDPNKRNQALDRLGVRLDTAVASVRSAEQRGFRFDRLPNTRKEVSAIGDLLGKGQCEVFLDSSALEEVLQARKAPRILHLATHGFFLKDQELPETRGIGGMVAFTGMDQGFALLSGPRINIENPLLRSGIALAGANRAGSSGQGSDGILTADEVLGLRLRGTELVVLSACETGLGEVKTGEGVFGLRRAFAQAGARSMVMSMWSVPDRETQELMVEFYKNVLSGKMDRCQALRQAALTQKKIVQQRYGQDNPFFWGAFVFLGQTD